MIIYLLGLPDGPEDTHFIIPYLKKFVKIEVFAKNQKK